MLMASAVGGACRADPGQTPGSDDSEESGDAASGEAGSESASESGSAGSSSEASESSDSETEATSEASTDAESDTSGAEVCEQTPPQGAGPFPQEGFERSKLDIYGHAGVSFVLNGRLLDADCQPLGGVQVL